MLDDLTNSSKYLLSSMYKQYLIEVANGKDRSRARMFTDGSNQIHDSLMPEWSLPDIDDSLRELYSLGLATITEGSGKVVYAALTRKAVAQLETTFKDQVNSVLEFMAKVKDAIPFV